MPTFHGLHSAYTGIRAAQVGMQTVSNNIANVGTEGYTRQRVQQVSRYPWQSLDGPIGTGTEVTDIIRMRDAFADARVRDELSRAAGSEARASLLRSAELVFGELDTNLAGELNDVFNAFEDLALTPDSTAARTVVINTLEAFAVRFRNAGDGLSALRDAAVNEVQGGVDEINRLTDELHQLNRQIQDFPPDVGQPNDLLDQRDRLVDRLTSIAGVRSRVEDDGSATVTLSGVTLVSRFSRTTLSIDGSGAIVSANGTAVQAGGEIGGIQRFLNDDLTALETGLATFASDLVDALNTQHAAGYTPSDTPGGDLLSFGGTLSTLTVAITDPADLAAAGSTPAATFDGTNAQALADLRNGLLASGQTPSAAFAAIVAGFGSTVSSAANAAAGQRAVADAALSARESAHGVSLDEEMVLMLNYQRALEASSRVLTAIDEALDVLINRTGVVGR